MSLVRDAKNVLLATVLLGTTLALAQTRQSQPVTDSSVQASPTGPVLNTKPTDASAEASPIDPERGSKGNAIAPHTTLHVVLTEGIDSGNLKNGQMVHGKLDSSRATHANGTRRSANAATWKSGTPVLLTVIGTVPAGKLNAVGEISLEVVRVAGHSVDTNVLTFRGEPGHRDLPDSAPMIGTNAGLPVGTALTFVVQPPPTFSESKPGTAKFVPGSVTEHVSGSRPPNYGQSTISSAPGSGVDKNGVPVSTPSDQPQAVQSSGHTSPAANQMLGPTSTTTPR